MLDRQPPAARAAFADDRADQKLRHAYEVDLGGGVGGRMRDLFCGARHAGPETAFSRALGRGRFRRRFGRDFVWLIRRLVGREVAAREEGAAALQGLHGLRVTGAAGRDAKMHLRAATRRRSGHRGYQKLHLDKHGPLLNIPGANLVGHLPKVLAMMAHLSLPLSIMQNLLDLS